MTNNPPIPFKRAAVEPVECLKAGWNLVKDQYWLFVGITLVGMLIGSAVPLGVLMGPMMCGIYLALFSKRRGQPIEFGILFKGFDYFGQSVIAALLHAVPIMIIVVPSYLLLYVAMFVTMARPGSDRDASSMIAFFGFFAVVWFIVILLVMLLSILFTFAYPLIVDRGMPGLDAVRLSFKAALANFWRLLGLFMLGFLLGMAGFLCCIVGIYLIFPISFAASAMAYEQVFGLRNPNDIVSNLPPPPPRF